MTLTSVEPLVRPRRSGVDFIEEATRAAAVARASAKAANLLAAAHEQSAGRSTSLAEQRKLRVARRLRYQAAAHERDARCHDEAVLAIVSLADELRR